jgi:Na+/serine symporter
MNSSIKNLSNYTVTLRAFIAKSYHMYLVLIGWFYVTLMMTIAEATSPGGTLLGAFFTLILYGIVPILIIGYVMGAPARKKARLKLEQENKDNS